MPLDNTDKLYLAGLMRGVIRAIATGSFTTALRQGDTVYTQAENDLADVLAAISAAPPSGGLSEAQVEAVVRKVLNETGLKA